MPHFVYKARSAGGAAVDALIEAPDLRAAMDRLRAQKLIVLKIDEDPSFLDLLNRLNPLKSKVGSKDIVLFSRQLATLVSAGVALVSGLNILQEQIESPSFRIVVGKVKDDIESGLSISDSMGRHPEVFSGLYVSLIRAGEVGGALDTILERLSVYLEAAEELRQKVKGAMVYPAVVFCLAGAVTVFLLVVPSENFSFLEEGNKISSRLP